MAVPKYQHSIVLSQELEEAWLRKQAQTPHLSFNAFMVKLMREALCVSDAPTLTIPSGM